MIPILLTATVNPKGMQGANFSVTERTEMYADALRFYAEKGLKVVFAENSGILSELHNSQKERKETIFSEFLDCPNVELVDVSGPEYDQLRGKGYNETILLHKAILASEFVKEAGCFFKITGRLKVLNVEKLLKECENENLRYESLQHDGSSNTKATQERVQNDGLRFLADCKDHKVYEWLRMPINGHAGECRYWFATTDFFIERMWPKFDQMNDYTNPPVLAEDVMLQVCRETRGWSGCKDRFRSQARISGRGGHNLGKGSSFFYSTDNDSFALRIKCGIRQLLRWVMPWWRA